MMAGAAYPNMAAAVATIVRREGVGALFNGLLLSLVKQGPQMAITFATYEASAGACRRAAELGQQQSNKTYGG